MASFQILLAGAAAPNQNLWNFRGEGAKKLIVLPENNPHKINMLSNLSHFIIIFFFLVENFSIVEDNVCAKFD